MKNFLYYDRDFLNLFIAQKDDGFTEITEAEASYLNALDIEQERIKDIITKKQSNNIFNHFEKYIKDDKTDDSSKARKKDEIIIGCYLNDNVLMSFFCFSHIENLLSNEYRRTYKSETLNNKTFKNLGKIQKNFDFLKAAIPYDVFLCGENLFIPLNEKYLRVDKNKIWFSFEREIKIVGRVNKLAHENNVENSQIIQTLNEMQNIAFSMLLDLGFIKSKNPFIVTPIAVYI